MVSSLKLEDRGIRRERFAVIRFAEMPAVLIECGFMSDPAELQKIKSESYRREMVGAILDGILDYKRSMERKLPSKKIVLPPKLSSSEVIPNETIY
jgi:N-acetylmuramoyl-L-alanine amidase